MGRIKRPKHGPEWHVQKDLMRFVGVRGWLVERTHGNLFQQGFPDLYLSHPRWGQRWVDVKVEGAYEFTKAQRQKWPIWDRFGIGIWILTGASQDDYDKLFKPPNWRSYWKPKYGDPDQPFDLEELLSQLDDPID